MRRSDLDRLRDARDFAEFARRDAGGLSADVLAAARRPRHAGLYAIAILGEALSKISAEIQNAASDIEWRKIINLRHIIVHSYWQIDLEIIADVIANRIEPLIKQLEQLIVIVERAEK